MGHAVRQLPHWTDFFAVVGVLNIFSWGAMTNILNENGSADNSVPREDTRLLGNDQPTTSYSAVNDVDEEGQHRGDEEQQVGAKRGKKASRLCSHLYVVL